MKSSGSHDLTQGSIIRKLISFFLPVAAGTIVQQLYNTADAIIVSKFIGTAALAAVGGSTTRIINLLIGFFVALTSGASVVAGNYYGAKNYSGVAKASATSVVFCTITGLVLSVIGVVFSPFFLRIMNTPEDTLADSSAYLRICFAATVFVLLYNMGAGILRAAGDSQRPFYYLLACCVCNIVLDYVFVKIFSWGVQGAAAATAASQIISCVLVLIRMMRADEAYRFSFKDLKIDKVILKRMLAIGIPSGIQNSMFGFSNAVIQAGVNSLGTSIVAAWALTGKIDGFYWAIISAAGTAVMSFVGQNYGARRMDRVKECVRKSLILFSVVTVCMSVLILTVGRMALPLFSDDQALLDKTFEILLLFVPYYFTWTFIDVLSGALRGCGDALSPAVIIGLGICAFRMVWILVVFNIFSHTLTTLGLSYVASWVLTDLVLIPRYIYWMKKHS